MKLLHIDSSALGAHSVTRTLTAAAVAEAHKRFPDLIVEYRDLDADPISHFGGDVLSGADKEAGADGGRALQQFLDADLIVIGAPMYNFTIPSRLKAWIDRVMVAGKTFKYTESGPVGLAGDKRVLVAVGSGGVHAGKPSDFVEPYLRTAFGFMGISNIEFVRAEGVALSPQHRDDAVRRALDELPERCAAAA
jgi:FMN-dependent NADH-azoreductase